MINRHYNTFRHRLENFKSHLDREEYKKDGLTLQRNHQKDDVFKIDKTSSLYIFFFVKHTAKLRVQLNDIFHQ